MSFDTDTAVLITMGVSMVVDRCLDGVRTFDLGWALGIAGGLLCLE
jgi:hypothetical protein